MKRIYTLIVATLIAAMFTAGPGLASGVLAGERPPSNAAETGIATRLKLRGHPVSSVQKSDGPKFLGNGWEITRKSVGGFQKGCLGKGLAALEK
ncbi:MAG: hypothetical protein ACRD1T_03580 [Acidimicrobiia bacterium]